MLLGNYLHNNRNMVREIGIGITNPLASRNYHCYAAIYTGEPENARLSFSSYPDGTRPPESWHLAPKAGGLSSRVFAEGEVSDANAWAVKLAEAMLTGSGTLTAVGSLVVSLIASIGGSGEVSDADVKAFLAAVASIGGSGGVSSADLEGLGALIAAIAGSGTAAGSTATGTGELSADLVVTGTGLTTANVGPAVWATIIEAGYSAEQILRILAAHAAGAATGLEGANPQFTGIDGTTLRIDGTYSGGTRTIDSLDGS